ncbi:MAG: hypothetical protein WCG51_04350 [Elusimicrobiota bacterium]
MERFSTAVFVTALYTVIFGYISPVYSDLLPKTTQEYYDSGVLKKDIQVSSSSISLMEYYESGKLENELQFHHNKTAKGKSYYESGKTKAIVSGNFNGDFTKSFKITNDKEAFKREDGNLLSEVIFVDGKAVIDRSTFYTYEAAYEFLDPLCSNASGLDLISNPMELKNKFICMQLRIVQILRNGILFDYPWLPPDYDLAIKNFYGYISDNYRGDHEFVDGQIIKFIGKIIGTYTYTTTAGSTKTVPKIKLYAIQAK